MIVRLILFMHKCHNVLEFFHFHYSVRVKSNQTAILQQQLKADWQCHQFISNMGNTLLTNGDPKNGTPVDHQCHQPSLT